MYILIYFIKFYLLFSNIYDSHAAHSSMQHISVELDHVEACGAGRSRDRRCHIGNRSARLSLIRKG